jgi:hypothetical protein
MESRECFNNPIEAQNQTIGREVTATTGSNGPVEFGDGRMEEEKKRSIVEVRDAI